MQRRGCLGLLRPCASEHGSLLAEWVGVMMGCMGRWTKREWERGLGLVACQSWRAS